MTVDLSRKLRSGITVGELMGRSAQWWDTIGKHFIPHDLAKWKLYRIKSYGPGPMLKFVDGVTDTEVGNILLAKDWSELTPLEQTKIARYWHDYVLLKGQDDGWLMATDKGAPQAETRH